MKIAIPVDNDKSTIVKKTGQSAFFAIYENGKVVDYVVNRHGQGSHGEGEPQGGAHHKHENLGQAEHTNEHKKDAMGLTGCDMILVQAIGENMKEALESMGLKVKKIRQKHGSTADEVMKNFMEENI